MTNQKLFDDPLKDLFQICPNCRTRDAQKSKECRACGMNFSKWRSLQVQKIIVSAPAPRRFGWRTVLALALGTLLAVAGAVVSLGVVAAEQCGCSLIE
jgi:hypothetical protein